MYEAHHQPEHTLSGNPLTDFDYQLMMDANVFAKCDPNNPNMTDFNHPDYLALMQAHSLPLDPSSSTLVQEDGPVGSDTSNSSNEQLYYHQHHPSSTSSMDLPPGSSSVTAAGYHISNPVSPPHLSSASMYLASSAPSSIPHHNNIHVSSQQRDPSNDDTNPMTSHIPTTSSLSSSSSTPSSSYQQTHPNRPPYFQHHLNSSYPPYQQGYQNTSDPSIYPSLEEYAPFYTNESYTGNHAHSNSAIYEQFDSAASHYQNLEQFYGQPLDEQQQFFLMQQQQQRLWAEQQQQQASVPSGYNAPRSPTAYTTEADSRPQIYVRKACVACKQSHVACDVQRPCSRCVRLNKADSCVDAERKKRGRPCGSGKKKKEEEKEMRRREQQQQLHLLHHHHHQHHDPLLR